MSQENELIALQGSIADVSMRLKTKGSKMKEDKVVYTIHTNGRRADIFRTFAQYKMDLNSSHLPMQEEPTSFKHPVAKQMMLRLIGGNIAAMVDVWKQGETYMIQKDHPAFTDKNHRLHERIITGEITIDTPIAHEDDGFRVEGACRLNYSMEWHKMDAFQAGIASSTASQMTFGIPQLGAPPVLKIEGKTVEGAVEGDGDENSSFAPPEENKETKSEPAKAEPAKTPKASK